MTVRDLEARIEAAACQMIAGDAATIEDAQEILRAAFPELFTDPPTAWLAPWEMTEQMMGVIGDVDLLDRKIKICGEDISEQMWPDIRNDYLAKQSEGR